MSLVPPEKLYQHAIDHGYCLGAFNIYDLEMLKAVIGAAEQEHSPVIIQVSMGGRKYFGDLAKFVQVIRLYARDSIAPVMINHDHCTTFKACREAIEAGVDAVMFDGSHYPYQENIDKTREVVEYAHAHNVWVEAELGQLPGFEDEVFAESVAYTDPDLVPDFIGRTGCDALAVSVGTSHGGVIAGDYLPLDFERLGQIAERVHGYPLVLHGAASLPPHLIDAVNAYGGEVPYMRNCAEEDIARVSGYGVRKANMDVDNFLCFTAALRKYLLHAPAEYNPRGYLKAARAAFAEEVRHKMKNIMHSSGRY